ncbi:MAG TPA: response regulator [Chloroflexota bacterium]|jgi:pilus assembly protein CpaE
MPEGVVLLVDDSQVVLRVWRELFGKAGFHVITASSGEAALAEVDRRLPDVVVTDIRMPGMDGYELCRRIRARPDGHAVSILAITDAPELEAKLRGFEAGVDDFVSKDTASAELLARVQVLAARQRRSQATAPPAAAAPPRARQIVVCLSLKGGAGTSTIAANLALLLARQAGETVALLDLALQTGASEVLLDLVPRVDLGSLAKDEVDVSGLSRGEVRRIVTMHPNDVALLAAPRFPEDGERVTPELVGATLDVLADAYGRVVVDTPSSFSDHVLRALDSADLAIAILTPDVVGAKAAAACLHVLDALDVPRDRLLLVLNAPNGETSIDREQLDQLLRVPIAVSIPYEPAFTAALNRGQPRALQEEPRPSPGQKALFDLARHVERKLATVAAR